MFSQLFEFFKSSLIFVSLFCMVIQFHFSSDLSAQCISMEEDGQKECRLKVAYAVAGLAVVALGAGIGYAASCSCSGHKHSSSCYSSSSCSSSYSNSSCYSDYSSYSHRHHHHHHHHGSYSSYFGSSSSSYGSVSNDLLSRDFPLNKHKSKYASEKSNDEKELSGSFKAASLGDEGRLTAFVQLPNGSTEAIGTLSLSSNSSLRCGPFKEAGSYLFGVKVEKGKTVSYPAKVCTLEIAVEGSRVESYDFMMASEGRDPSPCYFSLN